MFSKVFRLEKKARDGGGAGRPASAGEGHPNYYPLQQATFAQQRRRITMHEANADVMEQELDLLELVCRSDSLHRRLDQLQAKYEKMDDGMDSLKGQGGGQAVPKQPARAILQMRVSKSFEENEGKKPGFFQRLFRQRLSRSQDNLLDQYDPPRPSSALSNRDNRDDLLPGRQCRSASEDMLASPGEVGPEPGRGREDRQSLNSEAWEQHLLAPPLPHRGGGLKRKRVIKIHNLSPIHQRLPGSTESFSAESTDSEREGRRGPGPPTHTHGNTQPDHVNGSKANSETTHVSRDGGEGDVWKYDPKAVAPKPQAVRRGASQGEAGNLGNIDPRGTRRQQGWDTSMWRSRDRPSTPEDTPGRPAFIHRTLPGQPLAVSPTHHPSLATHTSPATRSSSTTQISPCTHASPTFDSRIKPILKNPVRRNDNERHDIPATLPPLCRSGSSREVLLTRTPSTPRACPRSRSPSVSHSPQPRSRSPTMSRTQSHSPHSRSPTMSHSHSHTPFSRPRSPIMSRAQSHSPHTHPRSPILTHTQSHSPHSSHPRSPSFSHSPHSRSRSPSMSHSRSHSPISRPRSPSQSHSSQSRSHSPSLSNTLPRSPSKSQACPSSPPKTPEWEERKDPFPRTHPGTRHRREQRMSRTHRQEQHSQDPSAHGEPPTRTNKVTQGEPETREEQGTRGVPKSDGAPDTPTDQDIKEEPRTDGEPVKNPFRKDPVIKAHSADSPRDLTKTLSPQQHNTLGKVSGWDNRRPILQTHRTEPSVRSSSPQQEDPRRAASQDLLTIMPNPQELCKTISAQELANRSSKGQPDLTKTRSCQDLPTKMPSKVSIKELDHFLTAIIQNLESQLKSGSSLSISSPRRSSSTDEAKRRRWKKWEEKSAEVVAGVKKDKGGEQQCEKEKKTEDEKREEKTDVDEQKEDKVKEDASLGVPPKRYKRMNECGACGRRWVEPRLLPCLHTVCTPCLQTRATHTTTSTTTPTTATTTMVNSRGGSRDTPTLTQATTPIRTPTPTHPPIPAVTNPAPTTRSTTPTPSIASTTSSSSTLHQNGHYHAVNGEARGSDGSSAIRPRLLSEGENGPSRVEHEGSGKEEQQHHSWPPSHDLDSVIDMLTNMTPGSRTTTPRLTLTPSESPAPSDAPSSTSTTLDSKTRWRGSCESVHKGRGVYVVWCPECGYEAEVPPGGVECFPLNYILQKHLVLEALNSSSTTVYCDLCHDEVVAEERCETCPVNLCQLCSRAHIRQRRTTHHTVITLQEARSAGIREVAHTLVCATHGEGEVEWWCRGCQEPLCAACLATLHRGHPTATVAQEAPQARAMLNTLLERATTRVDELLSAVEELAGAGAEVQQRGRVVGDEVNSFIDDYILALEHHRTTLLHQVRQACDRAQRGMVVESQRAGQTASWLRQGCDLTHDLLHHAGNAEALALTPLLSARLQNLLSGEVRGPSRWCRLMLLRDHRAGRVRGHRLQGVIADAPANPAQSRLKPLCEVGSVSVGSRVAALVVAKDEDGQPITHGGEQPVAALTSLSGAHLCGCSVRDREDGSYEVVFSPPVPGPALLTVTIQGTHVKGSPLELTVTPSPPSSVSSSVSSNSSSSGSGGDNGNRRHTGVFHCCTFCSSSGDKTATCACSATMPGGYQGCGHNHAGHPGQKHWSCCAQTSPSSHCARPSSQYYQVTL